MNRKGPWEGYRRQAKPVVSFPPSFARTFSSRERRLGTRHVKCACAAPTMLEELLNRSNIVVKL